MRWAWAEVDLDAIAHNVATVREIAAPAAVWAVVKADGYGHGAVPVARAAIAAGAGGLCVALVQEGIELREAGLEAPILILSEQPPEQAPDIVAHRLIPTVYTAEGIDAIVLAARTAGVTGFPVHVKIDTGMRRVGADGRDAAAFVAAITAMPELSLAGILTHLAMADEPAAEVNELQLRRFDEALETLDPTVRANLGTTVLLHAANSAAALAIPAARRDLVRLGIAMYGIEPGSAISDLCAPLRPALSLRARVSLVRNVARGDGISYGHRHRFERDTEVATVPIGYADGVPRRLFERGGEVLIHGRRLPIVGVVTMDSLMVDCGDVDVAVGDEVVLIGAQVGTAGSDAIPAEEWAARLGTIGYEIVCGISARIERRYLQA